MDINKLIISKELYLKAALKKMDEGSEKILIVIDEKNRLYGTLTDGDIRRHILKKGSIQGVIKDICNKKPKYINENYSIESAKKTLTEKKIEAIPVLNANKEIVDIILWNKIFKITKKRKKTILKSPVVIMAGGKGTRLEPLTRILPKPLIPIGDKPVIVVIMERYVNYGVNIFYISINHKAKMIKAYFEEQKKNYKINFIEEKEPLGTAGSLKLLQNVLTSSFFVSNCDIIIDDDYAKIFAFHKNGGYDLTLVASIKEHTIPYGVCEIESDGTLKVIKEKPEYNFLVNTGMYVLEPEVIQYIPNDQFFHMTDLLAVLKKYKKRIGIFPVSEKAYLDIGQWEEFKRALEQIKI